MTHWTEFVDPDAPDGAYLPWKRVEPRVGISRTTAWRLQKSGDFPKPYVVSPGRVAYRESEVEAWKASRAHRSAAALKSAAARPSRTADEPPSWTPAPSPQPLDLRSAPAGAPAVRGPPRAPGRVRRKGPNANQMSFDF
jgi:predicted DNA-binding transcriptional regulator AlpA